ncbi:MAG: TPM domain-containing protein [Acidobacteria bacterium]|nr:TPM domain-containing protein [Acidobacteriota bacterium]MBS1865258.1 TPM domain-containing protein [Acidobacteriota bacterium]
MLRATCSFRLRSALTLASLFLFLFVLAAQAEKPKDIHPTGYVTDLAGVISSDSKSRLDALCLELQQKTGAQLAIVTVTSLGDESVEQFANDLFKSFGVGQRKQDNGVLLLIAPNDRKYWTEVGYGLEPIINDARAGDAGRAMVPYFRQGNFNAGIEAAAWMLANYIAQDKGVTLTAQAPVHPVAQQPSRDNDSGVPWPIIALFAIGFIVVIISKASNDTSGRGGRTHGSWLGGGFGGGGWTGGNWGGGGWGGSSGGGGGFGGFGGGSSGGGGAGGSW